jgi:glutamine synthetase
VGSYTPLPWVREGLALVHCDPHVEGEPWPFAPRMILKALLERARGQQLELFVGAEVEYFLVARDAEGRLAPTDGRDVAARPCYDARGLTRMYEHLTTVSAAMNELGWGNYTNDHEDGNGQFEQNFAYADALTTADRASGIDRRSVVNSTQARVLLNAVRETKQRPAIGGILCADVLRRAPAGGGRERTQAQPLAPRSGVGRDSP